jgi:hypothetical protein
VAGATINVGSYSTQQHLGYGSTSAASFAAPGSLSFWSIGSASLWMGGMDVYPAFNQFFMDAQSHAMQTAGVRIAMHCTGDGGGTNSISAVTAFRIASGSGVNFSVGSIVRSFAVF